ncbi:MAG: hypothetical protein KF791_02955 [Verrucomicrobiae bacterium]|nr:hypothetical protein [Verrucomicrobiae bacterium]
MIPPTASKEATDFFMMMSCLVGDLITPKVPVFNEKSGAKVKASGELSGPEGIQHAAGTPQTFRA